MRLISALLVLALLSVSEPASANGGGGEAKAPAENFINLATVALPVVRNGQLINYVFASVRINLKPGSDVIKLREKEPYLRDALIRAAHRVPFSETNDDTRINEAMLSAAMLRDARTILGPGAPIGVSVLRQEPKRSRGMRQVTPPQSAAPVH
jgi:hypothetical protein